MMLTVIRDDAGQCVASGFTHISVINVSVDCFHSSFHGSCYYCPYLVHSCSDIEKLRT